MFRQVETIILDVCVTRCVQKQYIRGLPSTLFSPSSKNFKNSPKNFSYFRKQNFLALILKNSYIFSKKKAFLVLPEMEPCSFKPKFVILQETETAKVFLIFQNRETPKKFLIFQETIFWHFRKDIFRTPTYLKLQVYSEHKTCSEHCQISMMAPLSFNIKKFLIFSPKKTFLTFQETITYIS